MIEEPNFEYKYDLVYTKSFAVRLSFAILMIAACVFLLAVLVFFHFTEESLTIPLSGKLLKYGAGIFIVGLLALFTGCTIAIFHLVRPLRMLL